MAQELERNHVGDRFNFSGKTDENIPLDKRWSLKRYGTVDPKAAEAAAEAASEKRKHEHDHPEEEEEEDWMENVQDKWNHAVDAIRAEVEYLDGYRTATMMLWSAGAYTPLYVAIYKVCDRFMPHQTPVTVTARVVLSFCLSIPINAAFFTYGTFVHHTMEYMAIQKEWQLELQQLGISDDTVQSHSSHVIPYDWEMLRAMAKLKLESELLTTVTDSAKVWIPVNFLNFTIVPAHLRPLVLLSFSVFWNTYLSLAQHRDLSLPDR